MPRVGRDIVGDRDRNAASIDKRDDDEIDALCAAMVEPRHARTAGDDGLGRRVIGAVRFEQADEGRVLGTVDGRTLTWTGPVGRLDLAKTGAKK